MPAATFQCLPGQPVKQARLRSSHRGQSQRVQRIDRRQVDPVDQIPEGVSFIVW
jgi:hypothetical protein